MTGRCRVVPWRRWVVVLGLALMMNAVAAPTEHWYRSSVDHYATRYYALVLMDDDAGPAVRRLDLIQLGLSPPKHDTRFFRYRGELFYPVAALPDLRVRIEHRRGWVHVQRRGLRRLPEPPSAAMLLAVALNGQPPSEPVYVAFHDGEFYIQPDELQTLGLNPAALPAPRDHGYALRDLAGPVFTIDVLEQSMTMDVDPDYLVGHHLGRGTGAPSGPTPPSSLSAVVNYDLSAGADGDSDWWAGSVNSAVAKGSMFCEDSRLYRSRDDTSVRLGNRCVWDMPDKVLSVSIGDTISNSAVLGQPVRYGGVRIGTNYGLAPSFMTQPYLSLAGTARVPSVLEIWTNQMLQERRDLPPGPFRIDDLPAYNGAGEMRAVIRDGSGTPITIRKSFYSDPALLAPGLSDWSLEYGWQRRDAFSPDDRYDREAFAAFTGRHGVSDRLTLGVRGEHFDDLDMLAANAYVRLWQLGTVEVGAAGSRMGNSVGRARVLGFSRRSRYWSVAVREQRASSEFVELGYEVPGSIPAVQRRFSLSLPLWRGTAFSVGRVSQEYHDERADRAFNTAGLTLSLPANAAMLMSVFRPVGEDADTRYSVALTVPLGRRRSLSASGSGADLEDQSVTWQTSPPAGPGTGYRASAGRLFGEPVQEGSVTAQNQNTRLRLFGRRRGDTSNGYAELDGTFIANREGLSISRARPGSYAIVNAGAPGVRVFRDNHLMGHTGENGKLVVPGLLPYQDNRLRLAPEDLPLNAQMENDGRVVVPGKHQALAVAFPVTFLRYVNLHLVRHNGEPVPAGARADLVGGGSTVVGRYGLLYHALDDAGRLAGTVSWSDGECRFSMSAKESSQYPLEREGVLCR